VAWQVSTDDGVTFEPIRRGHLDLAGGHVQHPGRDGNRYRAVFTTLPIRHHRGATLTLAVAPRSPLSRLGPPPPPRLGPRT